MTVTISALSRRRFLKAGTASALGLMAAPMLATRAEAATRLTVASLMAPEKPETLVWHKIAELAEARLPGAFSFNIVANAALGGEREVAQAAKLGSVQASLSTISMISSWVPEAQIFDLPFLFRDAAHLKAAGESDIGADIRAQLEAQGFVTPAFINYGARHLLSKTPVTEPSALKGLNMRVIQSPLHTELWKAYGANPTGIPIVETYNALQTGVADAMDLTTSAYAGFKLYEVVPSLTATSHIWAGGIVYFAQSFWRRLSDEQKGVLSEAAVEGAAYFNELMAADEAASLELAVAGGAKVIEPTDRAAWEAGARPVWEQMAAQVGGMDRIEALRAL